MLVDLYRVADQCEIDIRKLADMVQEVAFEHDLPGPERDGCGAGGEVGGAGEGGVVEADEVGDVCLGGGEGRVRLS